MARALKECPTSDFCPLRAPKWDPPAAATSASCCECGPSPGRKRTTIVGGESLHLAVALFRTVYRHLSIFGAMDRWKQRPTHSLFICLHYLCSLQGRGRSGGQGPGDFRPQGGRRLLFPPRQKASVQRHQQKAAQKLAVQF